MNGGECKQEMGLEHHPQHTHPPQYHTVGCVPVSQDLASKKKSDSQVVLTSVRQHPWGQGRGQVIGQGPAEFSHIGKVRRVGRAGFGLHFASPVSKGQKAVVCGDKTG